MDPTDPSPLPPEPGETPARSAAGGSPRTGPGCAGFYTARDVRSQRRFNVWLFAAMLAYLGATAAIRWRGSVPGMLPWLLTGLAWILSLQATRSYLLFLRGADELLRRIQLEALALGFGAGAVFSLLYPLLEGLGAPKLDGNATVMVMMFSWGAGTWVVTRRYCGSGAA